VNVSIGSLHSGRASIGNGLTLPVTLSKSGTAYAGFLSRSITAYRMPQIFRFTQGASDVRYGRCCLGCWSRITAARRMKGVVKPQHAPTAKKLRTHRQIGGEAGPIVAGPSGSIVGVGLAVYQAGQKNRRYVVARVRYSMQL
jgi:hypothetical protein